MAETPSENDTESQLAITWPDLISELVSGENLPREHASWAMKQVMSGSAAPIPLAGFLVALASKGETVEELRGLADEMVAHARPVPIPQRDGCALRTVDIVGTGGDRHNTVNISTMAALVVAGTGLPVAKHGNRAASSASGSADVLEALGVRLDVDSELAGRLLADVGITFLFAQQFHPAFRHAVAARVGLGIPTAFNVLGPITNPAKPEAGAIGVGNSRMAPLIAGVFADRGKSSLVFRSEDGLDELATTAPARIWEVTEASSHQVKEHLVDFVAQFGFTKATISDLRGGSPTENASVAKDLFQGKKGPIRDAVVLNAAAAVVADGRLLDEPQAPLTDRFAQAIGIANRSLEEGDALKVLQHWVTESNK